MNKSEKTVLRHCAERARNGEPALCSELWTSKHSTFCLHSTMFESLAKKLEPIMPVERTWVERREGRFVLFTCLNDGTRNTVRYALQAAASTARRRARVANAIGHHLPMHYSVLWEIQNGRCYFSGEPLGQCFKDRKFAVDHLDPLAVRSPPFGGIGGTNWPINLALVTKRVNAMKGSDDAETFVWRLKHEQTRYSQPFIPTTAKERRRIDRLRRERFATYMRQHCKDASDYR